MKKFSALVFMIFIAAASLFSFARNPYTSITGQVTYYGSDGDSVFGVKTEDNKMYTLRFEKDSKTTEADLSKLQSYTLELTGSIDDSEIGKYGILADGVFTVAEYKILK